jgi:predicted MFS family arabinose efflux permease
MRSTMRVSGRVILDKDMTMTQARSGLPIALYALTAAAFGIGTTEFVIMGLLLDVGRDLGVSIPMAGLLITGYALGVVVGAPVLTALTSNLPRKKVLLGLTALFAVGNLLCAISPTYGVLMAAGVITALAALGWVSALVTLSGLVIALISWSLDPRPGRVVEVGAE